MICQPPAPFSSSRTPVRTSRAMAQVYSPTPHRIALCALARHLNYHPEDEDVELEGRARRDATAPGFSARAIVTRSRAC